MSHFPTSGDGCQREAIGRSVLLMLWGEKRKQLACEEKACERGEASGKLEPMSPQDDLVREQQETIRLQQVQIESLQETMASLQEELARSCTLCEEVVSLREQVEELSQENQRLQDRLKKNSSNSSLPPSSDRFARQKRSLREKSGKKVGGQPGHPGQTLCLKQDPDEILIHAVKRCEYCQADARTGGELAARTPTSDPSADQAKRGGRTPNREQMLSALRDAHASFVPARCASPHPIWS